MKTLKLFCLLLFIAPVLWAKIPSKKESRKGLEVGFVPTEYGKKKDGNDGFFKQFDYVWKQNDNLYVVKKKIYLKNGEETQNAWLVDKNGQYLTKKSYTDIGDFSEGMAEVTFGPNDFCQGCYYTGRYNFVVHLSNTHGFINEKGEEVISPKYRHVYGNFKNGVCLVGVWDNQYYFIDKTGKQQFNKVFRNGEQFRGHIAGVTFKNGTKNFIDKNGEVLIPKKYLYIQPYNEEYLGMIRAYKNLDKKIGFWTADCKNLVAPQYDSFSYSSLLGNIMVEKDGKFGFIDMFTGKEKIPNIYSAYRTDKNRNYVLLKSNKVWLRLDGKNISHKIGEGDDIHSFGSGLYKLKRGKKLGIVDSTASIKSDFIFDQISDRYAEQYFIAQKGQDYGLINANGEVFIEPKYDKVGFLKNDLIYGQKGLYQFTFDATGKELDKQFKPEIIKNTFFGLLITLMLGLTVFVFKVK
jgi:hypothetical protein